MTEGEIRYPHAEEEGVTPEMEKARKLGLLTPMSEDMEWLSQQAENKLKIKDGLYAYKSNPGGILDDVDIQDPHQRLNLESEFATDRGLVEVRRLSEINIAMAKEITDMMLGYDIELFRTPNQIQLASIREALITAFQKDPEIDDRMKAKERIREILELEKQLSEYLTVFGQEVRDIINGQ